MGNFTSLSFLVVQSVDYSSLQEFVEYTESYNKTYASRLDYQNAYDNYFYNMIYHIYMLVLHNGYCVCNVLVETHYILHQTLMQTS